MITNCILIEDSPVSVSNERNFDTFIKKGVLELNLTALLLEQIKRSMLTGSKHSYIGNKIKQKNISGSQIDKTGGDTTNTEKLQAMLQAMLQVCKAEKAVLEKLLESKDRIIELLEKGGK